MTTDPTNESPTRTPVAREYACRLDSQRSLARRLDRAGLWAANARLLFFGACLALAALAWARKLPPWSAHLALGAGLLFVAAAVAHDRLLAGLARARVRCDINERALARLGGRWTQAPSRGDAYVRPEHACSSDLDLFGASSLFQLLNAATGRLGEERLAGWLRAASPPSEILERQVSVRELAPRIDWREDLETEGTLAAAAKPDPDRFLEWAEGAAFLPQGLLWRLAITLLPLATLSLYLAAERGLVPRAGFLAGVAVQLGLVLATRGAVRRLWREALRPSEQLLRLGPALSVVERLEPRSPALGRIRDALTESGAPASVEMRRLRRLCSFLELREQPLFHVPLNLLLLWDLQLCGALLRWQRRCGGRARGWLGALAEAEALSSLARFAYENPAYAFASLRAEGPLFVGEGLAHPLLPPERRVENDVSIPGPGRALVITGSNMAGKTTLLRTIGVNAVLALAGAPSCCRSLEVSSLEVRTSMRVNDSLAQGLSLFYAEIRRLKALLDACRGGPALYLLDEVLHGTNTAERQLASKAILGALIGTGAIGAVATHDLSLTALEAESAGRARCVHFADHVVDGEMSFDYKLRPGIVSTSNALLLLRRAGILP